jgi:hypothetical protein
MDGPASLAFHDTRDRTHSSTSPIELGQNAAPDGRDHSMPDPSQASAGCRSTSAAVTFHPGSPSQVHGRIGRLADSPEFAPAAPTALCVAGPDRNLNINRLVSKDFCRGARENLSAAPNGDRPSARPKAANLEPVEAWEAANRR